MDIFHKKERNQLVTVVVALSVVIAIMAVILGYFVWRDSTRICPQNSAIVGEKVGTVTESDADQDGLTDADEVNIYKTDPANPDTDGDGYSDGMEISGGYDPLVPAGN